MSKWWVNDEQHFPKYSMKYYFLEMLWGKHSRMAKYVWEMWPNTDLQYTLAY